MNPTVIVFRESILARSETFILEQTRNLTHYRPVLAGLYRLNHADRLISGDILLTESSGLVGNLTVKAYRYLHWAPTFYRKIAKTKPTLVHAHFAIDAISALTIAERMRLPLVVTFHGFDVTSNDEEFARTFRGRHYLKQQARLASYASAFLCVSQYILDAAIQRGYPREKLYLHHIGVDCRHTDLQPSKRDRDLILFVGRLVEVKGCEYLLRAMQRVQEVHRTARLEIIGNGPLEDHLRKLSAELEINVTFRGAQEHEEVLRSMSRARLLCNPSVRSRNGQREALGMVFAEAQALGTPVVSTFSGGIPEVVRHGETGFLCQEGKADELATAILTLLQNDGVWGETSRRGMSWIRENFNIALQTQALERIYDSCTKAPRDPAVTVPQ